MQDDVSAPGLLGAAQPDLVALMQAWSPDMQAQIHSSPLPDPRQVRETAAGGWGARAFNSAVAQPPITSLLSTLHRTYIICCFALPCLPCQDVDVATFARMVCAVLDLHPPAGSGAGSGSGGGGTTGLIHSLHALFALYLEFKHNPAFQHHDVFGAAAALEAAAAGAAGAVQQGQHGRQRPHSDVLIL